MGNFKSISTRKTEDDDDNDDLDVDDLDDDIVFEYIEKNLSMGKLFRGLSTVDQNNLCDYLSLMVRI